MALAITALFFALRKDAQVRKAQDETKKAEQMAEVHAGAAKKAREQTSRLADQVGDLKLRAKSAEEIAKALDEAKLPAGSDGLMDTIALKTGDIFKAPAPVLVVDPKRAASSANALLRAEAKAALLASCQRDRDIFETERDQTRTDLVKAKARFSKGILIGAGGTVVTFVAVSLLTKKKTPG